MFETIAVLIPTRGRVARLRVLIDSFRMTSSGHADLLFRVDEDDQATRDLLASEHFQFVVGPRLEGYTSLPVFFNELALAAQSDVMMCGNDDMVFVTPFWDRLILDEANRYPDGIFDIGVSTHNEANFPFATVSRRVVDRLGFIFDPRYFWGDIFLRDVMSQFERALPMRSVRIDHDWVGFAPDRVFLAGQDTRHSVSEAYHAQAVYEAVEKLRTM